MPSAQPYETVSVIGGGAWGTALANLCRRNGSATTIWAREADVVEAIRATRENRIFLPGVPLDAGLRATGDLAEAGRAEALVFVVPMQFARSALGALRASASADAPVILCSKGIEQGTGLLLTEVFGEVWPGAAPAVLSGPSFARDVARGLPTAVTVAAGDPGVGARWIATLGAPHFRPYLSDDLIGVELGGAVKNVLAIGAGAVIGRGLGDSARAALIARGFAEMQRLGAAIGAKRETMAGLSGLGDLILTACSAQSRNFSLGAELGKGGRLSDILASRQSVAEGVATAPAVVARARKAGVETPVCAAVADLLSGIKPLDAIIAELLARPLKSESD
ncbi:MAG: NAD(P)-dependent glycerol-3-phosphate dehydrogenase [Parvularculaceae bacterium]|jgi:glycerol-3-phosphate dehydrogenase (NAD(P)+)|nr:NAD(P)-dependent glycerol-3-phosphate dehydrogenase [Parvularculaceae bacterium]